MPKPKTTIADIAAAAGVSTATVSKALNGKGRISAPMCRRIREIADSLDYSPNQMARALARGEVHIAVLCPDACPEYQDYIFRGIEQAFAAYRDAHVTGVYFRRHADAPAERILADLDEIEARGDIDGVILQTARLDAPTRDRLCSLTARRIPVVRLEGTLPDVPHAGFVMSNGPVMGRMAAQCLHALLGDGAPVAVLSPDPAVEMHEEFIRGFTEGARIYGLQLAAVWDTGHDADRLDDSVGRLLATHPALRGLYVSSAYAAPVCACLSRRGLAGKLKVIGQDLYPALADCLRDGSLAATLFQQQQEQGRRAVEMLLAALSSRTVPLCGEYVTPQLVMLSNLECYSC